MTSHPLDATTPSMPTVAAPRPPTLPQLISQQVATDRSLARIERGQWYILVFLVLMDVLLCATVGMLAYLVGHVGR